MDSFSASHDKQCFYLPIEGNDAEIRREAFNSFLAQGYGEGWLAFHTIKNIEVLCMDMEFARLKPLITSKETRIGNFIIHRLLEYTLFGHKKIYYKLPLDGQNRPLLAMHPSEEYLLNLDKVPNVPIMIVVPWMEGDVLQWIEKNNAKNLFDHQEEGDNIPILDLNDDLKELFHTNFANINFKGLWEIDIQQKSKDLFTRLNNMRVDFDPRAIKQYLHKELGWNILTADRVYRIAEKFRSNNQY